MTLPTRTPILSSCHTPAAAMAATFSNARSVAAINSLRLAAKPRKLRIAASDEPLAGIVLAGQADEIALVEIFGLHLPFLQTGDGPAFERRDPALRPPFAHGLDLHVGDNHARSPTMVSEAMPKLSRAFSTCGKSVLGSAVLPSKTETATGSRGRP